MKPRSYLIPLIVVLLLLAAGLAWRNYQEAVDRESQALAAMEAERARNIAKRAEAEKRAGEVSAAMAAELARAVDAPPRSSAHGQAPSAP